MKKNIIKYLAAAAMIFALALPLALAQEACAAGTDQTYTVTANLYVPGDLNTQLPGVTAYLTNGNNPLGIGGYDAVAPTTPVSGNATLTVASDGAMTLSLKVPNPVFTLQKIGGCSNADITDSVRDGETYATMDGSVSRDGRITKITVDLKDRSGTYVFTDCTEFPTLLGVDWTVPLTLSVDLSSVPESAGTATAETSAEQPADDPISGPTAASAEVNLDKLKAIIGTVEKSLSSAVISEDGSDVKTSQVWVTQRAVDSLSAALAKAKAALAAADQKTADAAATSLTADYKAFTSGEKSGGKLTEDQPAGKPGTELEPGTYTVSANIWFNKADTGLPLNPHITNSIFPPMNPVKGNAALVVKEDGTAKVTVPITIQDKVMTVQGVTGLDLSDTKTNGDGAVTELTVDLGKLGSERTVVTKSCSADIQMGDLAMSISGLERDHTWPATFELNLSGVATKDGGTMPTVEFEMMSPSAAAEAMASVGAEDRTQDLAGTEKPAETQPEASGPALPLPIALVAVVVIAAAVAAVVVVRKRKNQ